MSKLLEFRERLNLTQEELAEKSGISIRTIQRIEAGTEPKGYTLKTLAKTLGVGGKELLEEKDSSEEVNYTLLKLINLSSLLFTFAPPANIVLPLIIMFVKKQFSPLAKQIVSVQILWTVLSVIIFIVSSIMKNWFYLGSKFILMIMSLLILTNVFIILRNAAEIDKNRKLRIRLNFNII